MRTGCGVVEQQKMLVLPGIYSTLLNKRIEVTAALPAGVAQICHKEDNMLSASAKTRLKSVRLKFGRCLPNLPRRWTNAARNRPKSQSIGRF